MTVRTLKASDLKADDVVAYCGAKYKILWVHEAQDGLILFDTQKRVDDTIISQHFQIVRHQDEEVYVLV